MTGPTIESFSVLSDGDSRQKRCSDSLYCIHSPYIILYNISITIKTSWILSLLSGLVWVWKFQSWKESWPGAYMHAVGLSYIVLHMRPLLNKKKSSLLLLSATQQPLLLHMMTERVPKVFFCLLNVLCINVSLSIFDIFSE